MDGGDEGDVLSGSDGIELTGRIEDIDSGGCRLLIVGCVENLGVRCGE